MQLGFYFDQSRCTGCHTCAVACKDWHDIPAGPANWIRVNAIEKGKYPHPFLAYLAGACYHCAEPACVPACPVGAITKRKEDGVVIVDRDRCEGNSCRICKEACPYDAPQFGAEEDARVQKCDLCFERFAEGKKPVCAEACPMQALDAGPIDEMENKYGQTRQAEGFEYSETIKPNVCFKPKT